MSREALADTNAWDVANLDRRVARVEAARAAVRQYVRAVRKMTVAEAREGRAFVTEDARAASFTITMSMREALALIRVLGPVGGTNGDGPLGSVPIASTR